MKWKIAISGLALLSIAAFLAISFRPKPVKRPVICSVHMLLHANGVVVFDGSQFSDDEKLKVRLVAYKKKNPDCFLSVTTDESVRREVIEHGFQVMHQAGFSSVGFISEPHPLSH